MNEKSEVKKVALVNFGENQGFAGEPITFVNEVLFFDTEAEAVAHNEKIWKELGSAEDYKDADDGSFCESPCLPYEMFVEGEEDYQRFAIEQQIIELSREEIEAWIR